MTQLTPHFALEEFQKGDPIPSVCIGIITDLCEQVLEPVREEFGVPFIVTSGYRSPKENAEAHGQPDSEHIWTGFYCAADGYFEGVGQRIVFDWMRQNPRLPFHQLILESSESGTSIIHVSINRQRPGVRSVLVGATHNAEPYAKVDYVAFDPRASEVTEA